MMKGKFKKIVLSSILSLGLIGMGFVASGSSAEAAKCHGSYSDGKGDIVACV